MASELRATRVAEIIRAEIADMLTRGLKDPRIGFVSIMGVRMSPDLRYANVYVSLLGSESEQKSSMIGLKRSAGWIRKQLGRKMHLRVTPEVRFFEDQSLDEVFQLEEKLRSMHEAGDFGDEERGDDGEG